MSAQWDTSAIEAAFAAAAADASLWGAAMHTVAEIIPCVGAGLVPVYTHFPMMPHSDGVARLAHEYLNDGWHTQDQRYRGLPAMLRTGVTSEFDFATPQEIARNQFYQDFLVPLGCPWFAGVKIATETEMRCLTLQRSAEQGPFSQNELQSFAVLSQSLSATAVFAQALSYARAEAAMASFEASGTPIFLMNSRAEVASLNHAAEQLIGAEINIVAKRLVSWSRKSTVELNQSLTALFRSLAPRAAMPPVVLPKRDGKRRPLLAYAMRLPPVTADVFGACRAVIVITDLDRQLELQEEILQAAFKLTPMEAKVARHIASGHTVETATERFNVNRETVKTHLKAIFAKTEIHRQSELIVLLSPLLRNPAP